MSFVRVSTAHSFDASMTRINQRSAELNDMQEKLAAGKRVLRASDDPVAATMAEREHNRLLRTEADTRALERSRSSLQLAEGAMGQMVEILGRFQELLVQGGNSVLTNSDRNTISLEMRGLRDQVLNLANVQDTEGNALLGGLGVTHANGRPFEQVGPPTSVTPHLLAGQVAATEVGLPNRVDGDFALRNLASADPGVVGNTDLFAIMQRAIDTLEDPALSTAARTESLAHVNADLQTGLDRLLLVRGRLGELLQRADSIGSMLQDRSVAGQQALSELTDLDMVRAISEFQTRQLGMQAALQSYGQVQRLSLFQFIA
jgi:flagellar hook-associated protein 3 FlgL